MADMALARKEPDQRRRVEVAKGAEPAPAGKAPEAPERPLTLRERFAAVRRQSFGIGKDDIRMKSERTGKEFTIKGHTIEAVLSEIRPLLDENGLWLTPSLASVAHAGNRCDVQIDFEWETLDGPHETRTIRWAGSGTDNSDKGFSKAGTNALKEHLKKLFLITDRDDAKEETDSVEHRTDEGVSRRDVDEQKEKTRAAIEQWAKAFKLAIEKAEAVEDLTRLQRDNRDQLSSETLPDVTRDFFIELIEKRKGELTKGAE